jgi:hypothetical protein
MDQTRRLELARKKYESLLIQAGDIMASNTDAANTSNTVAIIASTPPSATKRYGGITNSLIGSAIDSRSDYSHQTYNLNMSNSSGLSSSDFNRDISKELPYRSYSEDDNPHRSAVRSPELLNVSKNNISSKISTNRNDLEKSKYSSDQITSDSLGNSIFRINHNNGDDSRTVILALQVENERLKGKLNSYAKQAHETINKLQADHNHLENIFSQREKSLLRKIEQQNAENEVLRADFSKLRNELTYEKQQLLKSLRYIDRLKGTSRDGLMANINFLGSKSDALAQSPLRYEQNVNKRGDYYNADYN